MLRCPGCVGLAASFYADGAKAIFSPKKTSWLTSGFLLAGVLIVFFLARGWRAALPDRRPDGVSAAEDRLAREALRLKLGRQPDQMDVAFWVAERNLVSQRLEEAIACFDQIPTAHPRYGRMARFQEGSTLLQLHRAVESEQQLRELIAAEETAPQLDSRYVINARQNLRHILEVELRFEERHELLRGVIDRGEEDPFEAVVGCFPSLLRWNGPNAMTWLEQFREAGPASPFLEIAFGRYRTAQGKAQEARPILEAVIKQDPNNLRAIAALVVCLRESDDLDEARRVMLALPVQSANDPWWLLIQRGWFQLQDGQAEPAAAAYEQLLKQDRTSSEAWQGLAEASRLLKNTARRTQALQMVVVLGRIQNYLGKPIQEASNPDSFLDVADLCAEVPLVREGAVMTRTAMRLAPGNDRVAASVKRYRELLDADHLPPLLGP